MIAGIQEAVSIPVMAKARIGHFVEAQVLQALDVDYIDESEVLTPADEANHIDKWAFKVPFVCGATNLGEALRRIGEGAAMIRSKGEAGTGDIVEAVRHMRMVNGEIRRLTTLGEEELAGAAKELQAPLDLVRGVAREGKLPVVLFCAGGIATPADAALMMALGAEGVFVGRGSSSPRTPPRVRARSSRPRRTGRTPRASRRPRAGWDRDGELGELQARRRAVASATRVVGPLLAGRTRLSADRGAGAAGRLRGARADAARARCAGTRGAHARRSRGARGTGDTGRRVDDDDARHRARGARGAAARVGAGGDADAGNVRGADHARPRAPRADGHARERNAFGRQIAASRPTSSCAGIDGGPLRGVFIRAPWIAEHGPGWRSSRSSTGTRSRRVRERCWRSPSTRSSRTMCACTDCCSTPWLLGARRPQRAADRRRRAAATVARLAGRLLCRLRSRSTSRAYRRGPPRRRSCRRACWRSSSPRRRAPGAAAAAR